MASLPRNSRANFCIFTIHGEEKYLSSCNANPYTNRPAGAQGAAAALTPQPRVAGPGFQSGRPAGSSTPRKRTASCKLLGKPLATRCLAEKSPSKSLRLISEAFMHPWRAAPQR